MLIPPLRCVLRSLRSSSSARWFPRCGAVVVIAGLFPAVDAGDTVAVLLLGPLFRHAVVAVPQMFAAAAAGDTVLGRRKPRWATPQWTKSIISRHMFAFDMDTSSAWLLEQRERATRLSSRGIPSATSHAQV